MKKGAVVENSVGILIAVAIMVVIIFIGIKGYGLISDMLYKNQEIKFKEDLYSSFQKIRNMGYGSSDTFTLKGYGKMSVLCFVDIEQAQFIDDEYFPDQNVLKIVQSDQTNNVFPIGEENYYNVGIITVDSNNDGTPDNLENQPDDSGPSEDIEQGFVCIESTGYFKYVLTNMGRSVMVSSN